MLLLSTWLLTERENAVDTIPSCKKLHLSLLTVSVAVCVVLVVPVFMNYFDNPGGMIPTWLVNWAAKVSVVVLDHTILVRVHLDRKSVV